MHVASPSRLPLGPRILTAQLLCQYGTPPQHAQIVACRVVFELRCNTIDHDHHKNTDYDGTDGLELGRRWPAASVPGAVTKSDTDADADAGTTTDADVGTGTATITATDTGTSLAIVDATAVVATAAATDPGIANPLLLLMPVLLQLTQPVLLVLVPIFFYLGELRARAFAVAQMHVACYPTADPLFDAFRMNTSTYKCRLGLVTL